MRALQSSYRVVIMQCTVHKIYRIIYGYIHVCTFCHCDCNTHNKYCYKKGYCYDLSIVLIIIVSMMYYYTFNTSPQWQSVWLIWKIYSLWRCNSLNYIKLQTIHLISEAFSSTLEAWPPDGSTGVGTDVVVGELC